MLPTLEKGEYRFNHSMASSTWLKVGGVADVLFKPHDINELIHFLQSCTNTPKTILGNCSNVLIRDGGIEGVVIKLGRNFSTVDRISDSAIRVGAGMLNSTLCQHITSTKNENCIGGIEFIVGIPGTIGGGIKMNAGCYGKEFKDIVHSVDILLEDGTMKSLVKDEIGFKYRGSNLPQNSIVISAVLEVSEHKKEDVVNKISDIMHLRTQSQPIKERTAGSTFRNPLPLKAWQLIDQVGMRGARVGGAQFSEQHCNFMINIGNATARDFETLGNIAIQKVFEGTGIAMQWEIKIMGRYE
jgi:UDP-N-acetylmuramate dehydrogenase